VNIKIILVKNREKRKFNYNDILLGSTETVFSNYRIQYLQKNLININRVLLDVGCGAGNKIKKISKNFHYLDIIGIDISKLALIYAYKEDKKTLFSMGDAENLPIKDESIDYIVFFDLFEHLYHPKKAMKESYRVLKKGGIFHSYIPCEGQKLAIIGGSRLFKYLTMKYTGHIQHFTKQQIRVELENLGFTITDEKHSHFLLAQLVILFSYLLPGKKDRRKGVYINFFRLLVRILVSKIDQILSNIFPNRSIGYHITVRK